MIAVLSFSSEFVLLIREHDLYLIVIFFLLRQITHAYSTLLDVVTSHCFLTGHLTKINI